MKVQWQVSGPTRSQVIKVNILEGRNDQFIFINGFNNLKLSPTYDSKGRSLPRVSPNQGGARFVSVLGDRWCQHHPFIKTGIVGINVGSQLSSSREKQYAYGAGQSQKLQESSNGRDGRDSVAKSPTIKPLVWAIFAAGLGLFLCVWWLYLNDERRLLGAALIGLGVLLGAIAILPWGFL